MVQDGENIKDKLKEIVSEYTPADSKTGGRAREVLYRKDPSERDFVFHEVGTAPR